jgi:hypothetical protein
MPIGPPDDRTLSTASTGCVDRPCPYSEETVVGCRYYRPRSAHGDFPGAGQCADAVILSGTHHIRQTICRRELIARS